LGKTWKFKLKSISGDTVSSYVTLPAGTYDPNHDFNNSDAVSYTADFEFDLPYITTTAGIELGATSLGFNVAITGNGWKDTNDSQNNSHEYEIIYSQTDLGGGGFDNLDDVHHIYTNNTLIPIAANEPAR